MKKYILLIVLFLFSFGFSNAQGPVKKKKSTNQVTNQKLVNDVDEHAVTNDSIKIVNGRRVYIDKNGVQSFKVVQ
jgi:hypothetical protein